MTWVVAVIGAMIALYVLLIAALLRRRRRLLAAVEACRAWPVTSGTVVESRVHHFVSGPSHLPVVVYEYQVDGRVYRSDRLTLGEPMAKSFHGAAEKAIARRPPGAPVQVAFDPADPAQAVLERDAPVLRRDLVLVIVMSIVLAGMLIGLAALLRGDLG